jgi:hypothetical protein
MHKTTIPEVRNELRGSLDQIYPILERIGNGAPRWSSTSAV